MFAFDLRGFIAVQFITLQIYCQAVFKSVNDLDNYRYIPEVGRGEEGWVEANWPNFDLLQP